MQFLRLITVLLLCRRLHALWGWGRCLPSNHYTGQKGVQIDAGSLPQTIHNLIRTLQEKGYLTLSPNASNRQERILSLTEPGLRYAESNLLPLLALEESAICAMGAEEVRQMVDMTLRYGAILEKTMQEASHGKA